MSEVRASLDRMSRHGIKANRELGQNFLVDDNVLEVIGRTAELSDDDVVLEIGGGLGVLSTYLLPRVRHLHVVETDAKLQPVLSEALDDGGEATLYMVDVMKLRLGGLDPLPNKVVSNLPYGVATSALLRTIEELPQVTGWTVMVQREIADRLAASPGGKEYGIPSVLVQHACEVEFVRPISRNVFRPPPNVDSGLVRLRRTGPAAPEQLAELVRAAFAHRRKALPRSLEEAGGPAGVRAAAIESLEGMGHPPTARAETLSPADFVQLARDLERFG
ncbi:MAG TPA: 16S rRNA (adenine(1518)-N(6)/adenine(1519)-N(6))-dimethyltransferase RsmA [Solirubrobacterales bacterium]|nr:16S rRNA (adenine(1518)-N(6)/adenine(1519)-N(6))-dimethyltransferase RsmA [Solirubrobacterales bacterium]